MNRENVQTALDSVSDIQLKLANIAKRQDDERKLDLVRLRRQFAEGIGILLKAIDDCVKIAALPELHNAARQRLSALRTASALHQANWPAIKIDEDPAGYVASAYTVQNASDGLIPWLKRELQGIG